MLTRRRRFRLSLRLIFFVCLVLFRSPDDSMSGASVSDVNDRLSALELRVQQQEDELTVMKAALADVLRRLAASEVSAASSSKKQHGGKGDICRSSPLLTYSRSDRCHLASESPCCDVITAEADSEIRLSVTEEYNDVMRM